MMLSRTSSSSSTSSHSGGHGELCAASPESRHIGKHHPVVPLSSQISVDGRKRKNRGSSHDKEAVPADGIISEDWRSGGPHLCAIPVQTINFAEDCHLYSRVKVDGRQLTQMASSILNTADVNVKDIHMSLRQSVLDPEEEPVPTMVINATKKCLNEDWAEVCRKLRTLLQSEGLSTVSVELNDERAFLRDSYYPITKADEIFYVWNDVLAKVLSECNIEDWNSVGVYKIGKEEDPSQNPPTVLVTVKSTTRDWRVSREEVIDILNDFNLPMIGVKILRADSFHAATSCRPRIQPSMLSGKAPVGQSVAPHTFDKGYGTFGGYLEILDKNTGKWIPFGITCSHITFPIDISNTVVYRHKGMSAADAPEARIFMDLPSETDLKALLEECDKGEQALGSDPVYLKVTQDEATGEFSFPRERARHRAVVQAVAAIAAEKDRVRQFQEHIGPIGGVVSLASRTCRAVPSGTHEDRALVVMDWALLKVPDDRLGNNDVQTYGPLPEKWHWLQRHDNALHSQGVYELNKDCEVFKVGRATGSTAGRWSDLRHAKIGRKVVNGQEVEQVTYERTVAGLNFNEAFSLPGDSGALVFNSNRRVVGMVFGGIVNESISYVSHIEDLFADIKEWANGEDIRIMEMEDDEKEPIDE